MYLLEKKVKEKQITIMKTKKFQSRPCSNFSEECHTGVGHCVEMKRELDHPKMPTVPLQSSAAVCLFKHESNLEKC